MNDIDMSEYGIYLHCANCGVEKKVHTIIDGDGLCKQCFELNKERMQKGQKEIILVEIRDTVKQILEKLNQQK
jgi:anti-anti-sigma regulatory factor